MAPQECRAAEPGPPSEDTLKLIEAVLDYIRSNLANIQKVWGVDSVQYKSASEIMNSYLDENLRAHSVDKDDMAELLAKMSIDDTKR
ncbi:hypothetical protein DV736_g880, partial [Chaetothyriales sp. CBS 134916]